MAMYDGAAAIAAGTTGWYPTKSEAQKSKLGENSVRIDGRCVFVVMESKSKFALSERLNMC